MAVVGAAIGVIASWASTTLVPLLSGSLLGQMLSSVAFSALSRALQRATAKKQRPPGISTEYTTDGDTRPQSFMLGWSATGGHMICPPMSHGKRNAYLTYVIDLGNVPRHALVKLMINDEEVGFEAAVVDQPKDGPVPTDKPAWWYIQQGMNPANPEQGLARTSPGRPAKGDYAGKVWLRYYDGTQTEADPYLLQVYGAGTDWAEDSGRPWLPDMVGVGTCYAIVTFKSDPKLFGGGLPRCRFEMTGVPVYDSRRDSTVGGSGPQRAGNPTTWAPSGNAMLLAYNIFRGIPIPGGPFWGLGVPDADLPLSVWTPIFNTCEQGSTASPAIRPASRSRSTRNPSTCWPRS